MTLYCLCLLFAYDTILTMFHSCHIIGPRYSIMARMIRLARGWTYGKVVKRVLIAMGLFQAFQSIYMLYDVTSRSLEPIRLRTHVTWSYTYDIPDEGLENIMDLAKRLPNPEVRFYCGSARCMKAARRLGKQSFDPVRIRIEDLQTGTPLDSWFGNYALNKVIAGPYFRRDLQDAIKLGLLWIYGGLYVEPYIHRKSEESEGTTVSVPKEGCVITPTRYPMQLCRSEAKSKFVFQAIEEFLLLYKRSISAHRSVTSEPFRIHKELRLRVQHPLIPSIIEQGIQGAKYGLLSYDKNVKLPPGNIGDEVQSLASAHFIPQVDHFVHRDVAKAVPATNCTIIGNAYWPANSIITSVIPYKPTVKLIPVSMHLSHGRGKGWRIKSIFKKYSLVGARDTDTLKILKDNKIPAIFSGCLTLFFINPDPDRQRTDQVYIVDVHQEALNLLPPDILKKSLKIEYFPPAKPDYYPPTNQNNFRRAANLIKMYASAKVVITQRLHVALPCVALGTPVIFINSKRLYEATQHAPTARVTGLLPLFHTIDFHKLSMAEAKQKLRQFNWSSPSPNPNADLKEELKRNAWRIVRQDEMIREAAITFGISPYTGGSFAKTK